MIALSLTVMFSWTHAVADAGLKAYEKGNYKLAYKKWNKKLKKNPGKNENMEIHYYLGLMYEKGLGTEKDEAKSIHHILTSAKSGHAPAMFYLSVFLARHQHLSEMAKWVKKAADAGHLESQFIQAQLYSQGIGIDKNPSKAAFWYKKTAQNAIHLIRASKPLNPLQ